MNARSPDSQTQEFQARAEADDPQYKKRVAEPTMAAIDAMPAPYRALVHEFGYVDIYRAYKRGWSVEKIRSRAQNGVFKL